MITKIDAALRAAPRNRIATLLNWDAPRMPPAVTWTTARDSEHTFNISAAAGTDAKRRGRCYR